MKKTLILCTLALLTIALINKKSQNSQILDQQKQMLTQLDTVVSSNLKKEKIELATPAKVETIDNNTYAKTVESLSRKVFLTPEEHLQMREALMSNEMRELINLALNDMSMLTDTNFKKRLRSLDALYEGLKFNDQHVKATYIDLATKALSQKTPIAVKNNKKLFESFYGDRVEIAFMINKINRAQSIGILDKHPWAGEYFKRAQTMETIYEVAL